MSQIFENKLKELGIVLNDEQKRQFDSFYELLVEWNKVMNLTGITEYEEVNEKHFVDSLSITKAIDMNCVDNLIDIGTGAGFPGIPLKIAFPHLKVVLLDSLNKRIKFLNTVIEELELIDIETIHGRAEDFAKQGEYREQFDLCVSRAVANLSTLSEYCMPYIHTGGKIEDVVKFQLPGTEIGRSFVKIKKYQNTPKKYPRKAGLPAKEPIA